MPDPSPVSCPGCRTLLTGEARFCPSCGLALTSPCPGCGGETRFTDRFCIACGRQLHLQCAECGAPVMPTDRFCIACGTPNTGCSLPAGITDESGTEDTASGGNEDAEEPSTAPDLHARPKIITEASSLPESGFPKKPARKPAKPPSAPPENLFAGMAFRWPFRRSQELILDLVGRRQAKGERQFHIVAPPGSGKTIVGLELIRRLGSRALVLAPNTTIQAQWADKIRFFLPEDREKEAARFTSADNTGHTPITVLTYQALSLPSRDTAFLNEYARRAWTKDLIAGREMDEKEAASRLEEMQLKNPTAYREEIARYAASIKRELLNGDEKTDIFRFLHPSVPEMLEGFRNQGVNTVILDECHHLLNWWAHVLKRVLDHLDNPTVIGLTATPPREGSKKEQALYTSIIGEVDFEVPIPAVVKEGNLAPYADLVYFTEPLPEEHRFIKEQDEIFNTLFQGLLHGPNDTAPLPDCIGEKVRTMKKGAMTGFLSKHRPLALACRKLLTGTDHPDLGAMPYIPAGGEPLTLEEKALLLEEYSLSRLKLSATEDDRQTLAYIRTGLKNLGYLLTETGLRRYISPVDRVLGLSGSKVGALRPVLEAEMKAMGDGLRAAVICDYEKTSATAMKQLDGVLDSDAGGAVRVLRFLTRDPVLDELNPVMVTGQTILCDDDLTENFLKECSAWIRENGRSITLSAADSGEGFSVVSGSGPDFSPKTYVLMITSLFERGITRCLVGTRGLLGEGWDSTGLNTLIDLTAVTSYVSINQLRGRSLRIDRQHPDKLANNWDIVCVAPEYNNGLNDYRRFERKHGNFYGICEDGRIENGVGHISPLFNDLKAADIRGHIDSINGSMLVRLTERQEFRERWQIKKQYRGQEIMTLELNLPDESGKGFTPPEKYLPGICKAVFHAMRADRILGSGASDMDISVSRREGDSWRIFLETGDTDAAELFARSVFQLFQPVYGARYVIPRLQKPLNIFQSLLKNVIGMKYDENIIYHPIPDRFASSKKKVKPFTGYWNRYVCGDMEPLYIKQSDNTAEIEKKDEILKNGYRAVMKKVWR